MFDIVTAHVFCFVFLRSVHAPQLLLLLLLYCYVCCLVFINTLFSCSVSTFGNGSSSGLSLLLFLRRG